MHHGNCCCSRTLPSVTEVIGLSPPEGAATHAVVIGIGAVVANQQGELERPGTAKVRRKELPRKNAVLVFGATGRTGRLIVQSLVAAGRTVIAACRSPKTAVKVWTELGLQEGEQQEGGGLLFTETGVDVTQPRSLKKAVFAGATQVCNQYSLQVGTYIG
jgi:NADPH:quinone reductase-like Zn-dependent oxidoreductase